MDFGDGEEILWSFNLEFWKMLKKYLKIRMILVFLISTDGIKNRGESWLCINPIQFPDFMKYPSNYPTYLIPYFPPHQISLIHLCLVTTCQVTSIWLVIRVKNYCEEHHLRECESSNRISTNERPYRYD